MNLTTLWRTGVIALISFTLLASCGFHLRGRTPLSDGLSPLAVQSQDRELRAAIEEAIAFSGAQVINVPSKTFGRANSGTGTTTAATASGAKAQLTLTREDYERRVRTVDRRGLATSYYLVYDVDIKVEDSAGSLLLERKRIRQRRDFNFDSTQVLQKEGEERFLREDMQRELAQTILRLLATIKG